MNGAVIGTKLYLVSTHVLTYLVSTPGHILSSIEDDDYKDCKQKETVF